MLEDASRTQGTLGQTFIRLDIPAAVADHVADCLDMDRLGERIRVTCDGGTGTVIWSDGSRTSDDVNLAVSETFHDLLDRIGMRYPVQSAGTRFRRVFRHRERMA